MCQTDLMGHWVTHGNHASRLSYGTPELEELQTHHGGSRGSSKHASDFAIIGPVIAGKRGIIVDRVFQAVNFIQCLPFGG